MPSTDITPIELARERLALSRSEGVSFFHAWLGAIEVAQRACRSAQEQRETRAALDFARPHFAAAYNRRPVLKGGGVAARN